MVSWFMAASTPILMVWPPSVRVKVLVSPNRCCRRLNGYDGLLPREVPLTTIPRGPVPQVGQEVEVAGEREGSVVAAMVSRNQKPRNSFTELALRTWVQPSMP